MYNEVPLCSLLLQRPCLLQVDAPPLSSSCHQDKNESFFLLNNLLSLNSELENDSYDGGHRRDHREIFNMDWLDNLEFKEEQTENEEGGYPEKDSERKRKHNQGEQSLHGS